MPLVSDLVGQIRARDRSGLIGTPGYTLPAFEDCELTSIAALQARKGASTVVVHGPTNEASGLCLIHKRYRAARIPLEFHLSARTRDAIVILGEDCSLGGRIFLHAAESTVILTGGVPGTSHTGHTTAQLWSKGNTLFVGIGSTTNGSRYVVCGENASIVVGDDCMFASRITFRTDDMHSVIDLEDGRRLNLPADIVVEPHVWIGESASIMKGVRIGFGTIVGTQSLVLKDCPRFATVAGVPARVLRGGRTWDRHHVPSPTTVERLRILERQLGPFAGSAGFQRKPASDRPREDIDEGA